MSASPSSERPVRFVVVGFDHMHAGDQIVEIAAHPGAQLVGVWDTDTARRDGVSDALAVPRNLRFDELEELVASAAPDVAVVCSSTSEHLSYVEYFADRGIHVLLEKPFASSLEDAEASIRAAESASILLGVNWPLAWFPVHRTTRRLITEGLIGDVTEVHYYDGNRGPLLHTHGKKATQPDELAANKAATWWYRAELGGGSLRDYLGYGATLATWFRDGQLPTEITARTLVAPGDEVDEQSVVIAAYESGLSTFQTRWGTFTDPWTHQPYPRCGFVIVGSMGTIASFDYADTVQVQTAEHPEGLEIAVDALPIYEKSGVANFVHALTTGAPLDGPLSAAVSLAGQRIVEAAYTSAQKNSSVRLTDDAAQVVSV